MKLIKPSLVTDAKLLTSTVPENDFGVWESIYAYGAGNKVIKAHRIWESVQAANIGHDPETAGIAWWIDNGPVNRWGMFDEKVGTVTSAEESITVTLRPGRINSVALFQVVASLVTVTLRLGETVVYQRAVSMIDNSEVKGWYSYLFSPIKTKDYVVLTNIPIFGEATLEITMEKPVGVVSCGMCIVGLKSELGGTLIGPSLGINDFSRKKTDEFGNKYLAQGDFSKRMGVKAIIPNLEVDRVHAALSSVRAIPVVWIGSDNYSAMVIYGAYQEFEIDIAYTRDSYCTINIEGMI